MSIFTTLPTHSTRRHPLTGAPLRALARHPRTGRLVWPILGGDDTVPPASPPASPPPAPPAAPERPDGVSEEEWTALGDPGRRALVRERERAETAERNLAAARAPRPAPPKNPPATTSASTPPPNSDGVNVAAIVQQAVDAALKPFQEAEQRRVTEAAAERVRASVLDAARPLLYDPTDALTGIDLAAVVNDQGQADAGKVQSALDDLVTRKPHLARSTVRVAPPGIGGGAPAGLTEAEKVKAILADMQRATGVRLPTS